jgi:predicted phage terminase large subunit-like protein
VFKRHWFHKFLAVHPVSVRRYRFWDLAATEDGGDYTVGTKVASDEEGRTIIEDVVRGQWGPFQVKKIMRQTAELDGSEVDIGIEQEPGASGKIVAQDYIRLLAGFSVKAIPSTGSKYTRWKPLIAQAEAGNVILISAPWNSDWIDEMCGVPNTKHDDQADSVAGAFNELAAMPVGAYGVSFLR